MHVTKKQSQHLTFHHSSTFVFRYRHFFVLLRRFLARLLLLLPVVLVYVISYESATKANLEQMKYANYDQTTFEFQVPLAWSAMDQMELYEQLKPIMETHHANLIGDKVSGENKFKKIVLIYEHSFYSSRKIEWILGDYLPSKDVTLFDASNQMEFQTFPYAIANGYRFGGTLQIEQMSNEMEQLQADLAQMDASILLRQVIREDTTLISLPAITIPLLSSLSHIPFDFLIYLILAVSTFFVVIANTNVNRSMIIQKMHGYRLIDILPQVVPILLSQTFVGLGGNVALLSYSNKLNYANLPFVTTIFAYGFLWVIATGLCLFVAIAFRYHTLNVREALHYQSHGAINTAFEVIFQAITLLALSVVLTLLIHDQQTYQFDWFAWFISWHGNHLSPQFWWLVWVVVGLGLAGYLMHRSISTHFLTHSENLCVKRMLGHSFVSMYGAFLCKIYIPWLVLLGFYIASKGFLLSIQTVNVNLLDLFPYGVGIVCLLQFLSVLILLHSINQTQVLAVWKGRRW